MNALIAWIHEAFYAPSLISLGAALLWGLISVFFSPCHVGAIPLLLAYINRGEKTGLARAFWVSLIYGLGLLVMLAIVGLVTSAMGRIVGSVGLPLSLGLAIFLIIAGLWIMEVPPFNKIMLSFSFTPKQTGLWGAFILGLVYGVVLGPCSFAFLAPMLGFVFSAALNELAYGILLMLFYALGHTGAIVITGTLGRAAVSALTGKTSLAFGRWIKRILGFAVLAVGLWQIYDLFLRRG